MNPNDYKDALEAQRATVNQRLHVLQGAVTGFQQSARLVVTAKGSIDEDGELTEEAKEAARAFAARLLAENRMVTRTVIDQVHKAQGQIEALDVLLAQLDPPPTTTEGKDEAGKVPGPPNPPRPPKRNEFG